MKKRRCPRFVLSTACVLAIALFGALAARQAAADNCYECFYELCLPVPLGYGWDACTERVVCFQILISQPHEPPVYETVCVEVCQMRGQRCYELTDPG